MSGAMSMSCKIVISQATLVQTANGVSQQKYQFHVPKLMLINVMSLVPKMDEVCEFIICHQFDIAFITETWLKESVADTIVNIPGYKIMRKDRVVNTHGAVCIYGRNDNYEN